MLYVYAPGSVASVENVEEAPVLVGVWWEDFPLVEGVAFVECDGVSSVSFSFDSCADEPPEEHESFPNFEGGFW